MTAPIVKVGDTIRTAKPKFAGVAESYVHVRVDNDAMAEYATELVASGRWIVVSNNNERKDNDADC